MRSILVVCEGNVCRSPMAEGLLAKKLPDCRVSSAGLGALVGHPADEIATELMKKCNVDISNHRACQITRRMCLESDIVLVMEMEQRQRLELLYPETRGRVFRIGEAAKRDVPDPYRKSDQAFRDALFLIEQGVTHWVQLIQKL